MATIVVVIVEETVVIHAVARGIAVLVATHFVHAVDCKTLTPTTLFNIHGTLNISATTYNFKKHILI